MQAAKFFTKTKNIIFTAVICTLLWGSAFPFVKIGYRLFEISTDDVYSKLIFAGIRFALAGIFTILFGWVTHKKLILPNRGSILGITLLGLVQTTLQYIFFYIGLSYTTGVKGSILNATATFIAVLLAHFFCQNDRMTRQKALGCLVGFAGVVMVNLNGSGMDGGFRFLGEGFIILAAACFAVGSLISKFVAIKSDSLTITGWQLLLGGVVLVLIGVLGGGSFTVTGPMGLSVLIYLALLSSVAFVLWTELLKHNPVGKVSIYNFLTPVFGTLLSVLILREQALDVKILAALAFVCAGIFLVNRTPGDKTLG